MQEVRMYIADSPALGYARQLLQMFPISGRLDGSVTHILLPVPTRELPPELPAGATVIGGNLPKDLANPAMDLLQDPVYLAQNAAITAHGTIKVAINALPCCLWECETLILGWGRIAQCLAHLLKTMGVRVTVAARREEARAMAGALGFSVLPLENLDCRPFRLVFNTVPGDLGLRADSFGPDCTKIDLASTKALPGEDVIWARGLPGKETPESAGQLIASRVRHHLNKE